MIALLLLLACAPLDAATLSLPTLQAAPGSSIVLPLALAAESASVAGLQFDLEYDPSALTVSATLGEAPRAAGKTLHSLELTSGRRRFLVIGLSPDPIGDGVVLRFFLILSPAAPAGAYALRLANAIWTSPSGAAASLTAADGAVTVQPTTVAAPRLQVTGVLNSASLLPGPVAPGEFVTLVGAGIGPGAVLFDGVPAPLLYAGPSQINAVVPYAVHGKSSVRLQIADRGQVLAELRLPVADSAPALFTTDGSGAGPGAILNQGSTLNSPSEPAEKGSVITLIATGAGQTDPAGVDGRVAGGILARPVLPISVRIGGQEASVLYAGAAPGMIEGVLQVNCAVPAAAPSGFAIPIILSAGNAESPAGVTVAIR